MTAACLFAGILQNVAAVRPLYLALWCGLALVSGVLVVLLRSRWGRQNPFYRCAVASLLVHVVLVGLTMTVRQVVGDGGPGMGPPIHVKLIDDVQHEGPITLATPPALLVAAEPEAKDAAEKEAKPASDVVAETAEKEPVAEVAPLESPPLFEPPAPVKEEKIVVDETAEVPAVEAVAETAKPAEPVTPIESGPEIVAPSTNGGEAAAAVTDVVATELPATSPYAKRHAPDRLE